MKIKFEKINPDAKTPTRTYTDDACWDVYSVVDHSMNPSESFAVDTGLRFDIPAGYAIQVYSRSGLARKHAVFVANAPGVIDAGYTGELLVILYNGSVNNFDVVKGMKIAQIRLVKLEDYVFVEDFVNTNTERGTAGFGSSGI